VVVAVDIGGRGWLFGPTPEMIRMSFATLAVISLVAIIGPLLALPRRWHLPVILGELAAGIVLGDDWQRRLQAQQRDVHVPG
jgi:Kef-type K+ transport system membrane component KefB